MSNIDKQACDMEREYFILSTAHTQRSDPYITLWAADDSGSAKSSITCVKIITLLTLIP